MINELISNLSIKYKALIVLKYGRDLDNPVFNELTHGYNKKFGALISQMKRILKNPNMNIGEMYYTEHDRLLLIQYKEDLNNFLDEVIKYENRRDKRVSINEEARIKLLELFKTQIFSWIFNKLSYNEIFVISLRYGSKHLSLSNISEIIDIEVKEVRNILKKVLVMYKDKMNSFIDEIIEFDKERVKTLNK